MELLILELITRLFSIKKYTTIKEIKIMFIQKILHLVMGLDYKYKGNIIALSHLNLIFNYNGKDLKQ